MNAPIPMTPADEAAVKMQHAINVSLQKHAAIFAGQPMELVAAAGLGIIAQKVTDDVGEPVIVVVVQLQQGPALAAYVPPKVKRVQLATAMPGRLVP